MEDGKKFRHVSKLHKVSLNSISSNSLLMTDIGQHSNTIINKLWIKIIRKILKNSQKIIYSQSLHLKEIKGLKQHNQKSSHKIWIFNKILKKKKIYMETNLFRSQDLKLIKNKRLHERIKTHTWVNFKQMMTSMIEKMIYNTRQSSQQQKLKIIFIKHLIIEDKKV